VDAEKSGIRKWLIRAAVGAALLPTAIMGLWGYMIATKRAIHPDAKAVSAVTSVAPSPSWAVVVERARQIARAGVAEENLPGLSVAVGVGGEIVWAEGYGWANLEDRVPVTPDTPFRIGTASKALTSAAVGLLLDQGRLKLDDEIQAYVPTFPKKPWPVTLRQVMGHVAGIRRDDGDEERLTERCRKTVDGLRRFADSPLLAQPGTEYRYSSYGWILVSAAVEAAAGAPFFSFMRTQVFEPLGMDHTKGDSGKEAIPDKAVFYFPKFAADPRYGPQAPSEVDYSCFSGASAFVSTPSDVVRFVMAMGSGRFVKPETVQLLQTSQRTASGAETGYGLGWDLETATLSGQPRRVISYDGELMGGPVSSFISIPEFKLVVSLTSNISYADTASLALKMAEAFMEGVKEREP